MNVQQLAELESALYAMSDDEFVDFQMNLMDTIMQVKMNEGKCVFSEVEYGLLN